MTLSCLRRYQFFALRPGSLRPPELLHAATEANLGSVQVALRVDAYVVHPLELSRLAVNFGLEGFPQVVSNENSSDPAVCLYQFHPIRQFSIALRADRAVWYFRHDPLDRVGAPAALGSHAEGAIDLAHPRPVSGLHNN